VGICEGGGLGRFLRLIMGERCLNGLNAPGERRTDNQLTLGGLGSRLEWNTCVSSAQTHPVNPVHLVKNQSALIQTVLAFTNSRIPAQLNSRP